MSLRAIFCPGCGARYVVEETLADDVRVLCGVCGEVHTIAECGAEQATPEVHVERGPRVVVGHALPAAARAIAAALRAAGFSPVVVRGGAEVLQACDRVLPEPAEAVVLDVGVHDVLAFEVIEHLRQTRGDALPVVLLASVYEKTRYKRRPNRLYGADAYLELHHVRDRLGAMVHALLAREIPAEQWMQAPHDRAHAAPLRDHGEIAPEVLARRLLSDVALYNGAELARGVQQGAPFDECQSAVDAARQLFAERAPNSDTAFFDDELAAFTARLLTGRDV